MKKGNNSLQLKVIVSTIGIFIITGLMGWLFRQKRKPKGVSNPPVSNTYPAEATQSPIPLEKITPVDKITHEQVEIKPPVFVQRVSRPTQFAKKIDWKAFVSKILADKRNFIGYGLCLCFAFAVLGQSSLDGNSFAAGFIFYALAGVVFVIVLNQAGLPYTSYAPKQVPGTLRQPGLLMIPLFLIFFIIKRVRIQNPTPLDQWITLASWLIDILLFCSIVLYVTGWRPPCFVDLVTWVKSHRIELLGIIFLIVVALSLRIIDLDTHPYPPNNDEGEIGVEALSFVRNINFDFFGIGWSSQPNLSFVLAVPAVFLFKNTIFAIRFVSAIEGALTVIFLFFLARQEFGVRAGFLAAGALVALPVHLQFSRLAVHNIIPGFFATLTVWLFFRALRTNRVSSYMWAGLSVGFAFYTYLGSRLAMLLVFGIMLYFVLTNRRILSFPGVMVIIGVIFIIAAPMATIFTANPDHFMARMNGESIFLRNWMQVHSLSTGMNYGQILWDQFTKSSLVFITGNAPEGFFDSSQPYYPMIAAMFLVLGLAYTVRKIRQPIYIAIFAWFWSAIILGSTITVNAPSSQRLIMSLPAAALLVGLGINFTILAIEKAGLISNRWGWVISFLIMGSIVVYGTVYYFGDYRYRDMPKDYPNQAMIGGIHQALKLGPGYRFYLLAKPTLALSFANFRYLLPDYEKQELVGSVTDLMIDFKRDKGALFFALPEQINNLELIELYAPDGKQTEYKNMDYPDQALYYTYVLPPRK